MTQKVKQSTDATVQVMAFGTDGIAAITAAFVSSDISVLKAGSTAAIAALGGQSTIHAGGGCHLVPLSSSDVSALGHTKIFLKAGSTAQAPAWADIEVLPAITYDTLFGNETTRLSALTTRGTAALTSTDIVALSTTQLGGISNSSTGTLTLKSISVLNATGDAVTISSENGSGIKTTGTVAGINAIGSSGASGSTGIIATSGASDGKGFLIQTNGSGGVPLSVNGNSLNAFEIVNTVGAAGKIQGKTSGLTLQGDGATGLIIKSAADGGSAYGITITAGPAGDKAAIKLDSKGYAIDLDGKILQLVPGSTQQGKVDVVQWLGTATSAALTTATIPAISSGEVSAFTGDAAADIASLAKSSQVSLLWTDIIRRGLMPLYADGNALSASWTADAGGSLDSDQSILVTGISTVSVSESGNITADYVADLGTLTGSVWTPSQWSIDNPGANIWAIVQLSYLDGQSRNLGAGTFKLWVDNGGIKEAQAQYRTPPLAPNQYGYPSPEGGFSTWDDDFQIGYVYTQNPSPGGSGGSGSGSVEVEFQVLNPDTFAPIADVAVWVTTDLVGDNTVASGRTTAFGIVSFNLDPGTYYFWKHKDGFNFTNPVSHVVEIP